MGKTINMGDFDPLLGNLEEYVNEQGCTLGKEAEILQELLHCMRNDSFQSYVHTKEKINGESQNNLWTADTALDKMKNTYFIYKNSIFKEFAMIAYLDSLDSKHKNERLEQMRHVDKVYSMISVIIGMHISICGMAELAANGMVREEIADFAMEMSEDIRMFAEKYERFEKNI